jgi:hypothetical protein
MLAMTSAAQLSPVEPVMKLKETPSALVWSAGSIMDRHWVF